MRTTLDIPEHLMTEAMRTTRISTKTDLIKTALMNLIYSRLLFQVDVKNISYKLYT
jgi:Arc/MetJ family transcription regulator